MLHQMLAFPLCTLPGFSLSEEAVLAPALDVFAVLSTVNVSSASVRLVLFACACSWAGVYGALACTVCHSYTKSQFANSLPVKVRWTWLCWARADCEFQKNPVVLKLFSVGSVIHLSRQLNSIAYRVPLSHSFLLDRLFD
jgi:hypothetical protein